MIKIDWKKKKKFLILFHNNCLGVHLFSSNAVGTITCKPVSNDCHSLGLIKFLKHQSMLPRITLRPCQMLPAAIMKNDELVKSKKLIKTTTFLLISCTHLDHVKYFFELNKKTMLCESFLYFEDFRQPNNHY